MSKNYVNIVNLKKKERMNKRKGERIERETHKFM